MVKSSWAASFVLKFHVQEALEDAVAEVVVDTEVVAVVDTVVAAAVIVEETAVVVVVVIVDVAAAVVEEDTTREAEAEGDGTRESLLEALLLVMQFNTSIGCTYSLILQQPFKPFFHLHLIFCQTFL
jgi:hypothetical protein